MATSVLGSTTPEFGLTQYLMRKNWKFQLESKIYLLGAVVLILKQTFLSEGFLSFM